ncbi:hypothetical protein Ate01nite_36540 [Actinoplanes teichomyceticus]|nr:hypothetical protein Ate01nite_36540 [Actinoplanes teichomyceticus]
MRDAVLYRFIYRQRLTEKDPRTSTPPGALLPIGRQAAHMLDWLIRHHHSQAAHVVATIVGDAEGELNIPAALTGYSLRRRGHERCAVAVPSARLVSRVRRAGLSGRAPSGPAPITRWSARPSWRRLGRRCLRVSAGGRR